MAQDQRNPSDRPQGPEKGPGYGAPIAGYGFNRAFETIIQHKLISWSPVQGDAATTQPLQFGSHKSKLVKVLREEPHTERAKLSREQWLRLVTWIDANGPYHDRFVKKRLAQPAYSLPADKKLNQKIARIHEKRCSGCHDTAEISRADWIDIREPQRSLFLTAPLPRDAGGTGKCSKPTYRDRRDRDYQAVLEMAKAAVERAWKYPRRDLQGPDNMRSD